MYPVWTNVGNVYTQQGYLYVATDTSGNIIQNQSMFRDTSNNFHRVTAITASGNLTQGGSLDFTIDTGVRFPNGTSPANQPSTSFAFTGIFSQFEDAQTNWGAGHQSGAREEAA
jgi:hypothetical protein